MKYRVVRVWQHIGYSCSDHAEHRHRWWITAWMCAAYQRWKEVRGIG